MARIIDAEARIKAVDATGGTFDKVTQKMRQLEKTAMAVNKHMDSVSRGMSSAHWRQQAENIAVAERRLRYMPNMRTIGRNVSAIRNTVSEFASYAAPGAIGGALGLSGAAVGGLAVGGAAAYGAKEAVTFEKAMADVKKKVSLDEGKSFDDVEAIINQAARTYGMAREEVAGLTAQAGQSGVAFKELAGFIDLAVKAAGAWDMTGKDAAQTLAEIGAQTKWTIPQLKDYADKVNFLGDISAAAEKDIAAMSGRVMEASKYSGFKPDESLAALTALRSVGMDPEVSARFFGQFGSRLRTASSQDKNAKAAYKALGFTPESLETGMKTDAMGTTMKFLTALNKSKDPTKMSLATMGKEWFDEQLKFAGSQAELTRLWSAMQSGKSKGSMDAAKKTELETTASHLSRLSALVSEVGDRLTRPAMAPVNSLIDKLIKRYEAGNLGSYWNPFTAGYNAYNGTGAASLGVGLTPANAMGFYPAGSFQSAFSARKKSGWGIGEAAGSVAPGALAFGMGGIGDIAALNVAPSNPAALARASLAESAAALRTAPQPVKLEGAANISNTVTIEASPDFITKIKQEVRADGALRTDTGVSMAP